MGVTRSEPTPDTYGETWAEVYDELSQSRVGPPTDAQIDVLASLAGTGRALELGIGTGRVALPLAAREVAIHGVDASASMVARLREKPGGSDVPVTIGDMAEVVPDGPFRIVYVVFNTIFALLTQARQVSCFRSVAGVLEPGGAFLLECFVPDLGRFTGGQCVRTTSVGSDGVWIEASTHDAVAQRVHSAAIHVSAAGVRILPVEARYAWPSELDLMAALAGLRLRHRWDGWDREPFTASSGRHVSVYERPV